MKQAMIKPKKFKSLLLAICMLCGTISATTVTTNAETHTYTNGVCTDCGKYEPASLNSEGVYEISNAGQLAWFAALVNGDTDHADFDSQNENANAKLMDNIDLSAVCSATLGNWTPIGKGIYGGTFDGNFKTVSNLYINNNEEDLQGLFGYLRSGTIKNLTVEGVVNGNSQVGGICGFAYGGLITGCTNKASIKGNIAGGITGTAFANATITDCINSGTISGVACIGGIVGKNMGSEISNCMNTAANSGITGLNSGTVTNSYYLSNSETDAIDGTTSKTAAHFATGEVAYLLNTGAGSAVFRQTIGEDSTPVLNTDSKIVYKITITDSEGTLVDVVFYRNEGQSIAIPYSYSGRVFIDTNNHAVETITVGSEDAEYTAFINPSYTVTIPASVELGSSATISASDVALPTGYNLNVTLSDASDFKVKSAEGAELSYTITKATDAASVSPGSTVLRIPGGTTSGSETLMFWQPEATYAGDYTGSVTFTIEVE